MSFARHRNNLARQWSGVRLFIRQDLQQRFTGNAVGVAWALILPLLQLALFALLFVYIFKARTPPDLVGVSYLAFLALGMWPWFAFSEAVGRGSNALVDNAGLLGKVAIPFMQLILARVLAAFLLHGVGYLLILVVLALGGTALSWYWLPALLLPWALLLVLAIAVSALLAVLHVFVRDVGQIVPHLLTALLFTAPILYAPSVGPSWLQGWMALNPLAMCITAIRTPLLGGGWTLGWGIELVAMAAFLLLATLVYRRLRGHVEDFL